MIRAIVFDKDGTLLSYAHMWAPVTQAVCRDFLNRRGLGEEQIPALLDALGANDGVAGLIYCATHADLAAAMNRVVPTLDLTGEDISAALKTHLHLGRTVSTCDDLPGLLRALKERGMLLAVATSDAPHTTAHCLDNLGVRELFDAVYCTDGRFPSKPDPSVMLDFCRTYGLQPDEVLMVGDTPTDLRFAANAGAHPIGLADNDRDRAILAPLSERVLGDLWELLPMTESEKEKNE